MHPRQTLQEQFSTFAWFENDTFRSWKGEPRLRHSMAKQLEKLPQYGAATPENERFWSLSWYRCWRDRSSASTPAQQHLMAYLQEACYWAAYDINCKLKGRGGSTGTHRLADYFQMAIAEIEPALEKFRADQFNNLKAFAQVFLSHRLKGALRSQREADFCSDWGLLRKTGTKRILEAMERAGLNPADAEQYRLLWMGFQTFYVPTQPSRSAHLPEPDATVWEAIATFYNQKRSGQLSHPAPQTTAREAHNRLKQLAQWIRQYLYPVTRGLGGGEEGDETGDAWLDRKLLQNQGTEDWAEPFIEIDEKVERDRQQRDLQARLVNAFHQLNPQLQQILCLKYQQKLSQQDIGKIMDMPQPTVSRRLNAGRQALLKAIETWMTDHLNKRPDLDQIKTIATHLEIWLQVSLPELNLCASSEPQS